MSELWEDALNDYESGMKYKEIAEKYGVSLNTVKSWKTRHWNKKSVHTKNEKKCAHKKRGGQPGNKNSKGSLPGNQKARKHGFFAKWLPEEVNHIIGEMPEDPLDILWANIQMQMAAIVRAQNIMYVHDKTDMTKEVSMRGDDVVSYDVQQAWDKQANFMSAQSRAMKTMESMIKQYDELLHNNWELATEEQKARINQLKAQTGKITGEVQEIEDMSGIEEEIYGTSQTEEKT